MDRNCIRVLYFLHQFKRIFNNFLIIKFNGKHFRIFIDFPDDTHVAVKYSHAFVYRKAIFAAYFPFQLIVIFRLHDLISLPEDLITIFPFFFPGRRRI